MIKKINVNVLLTTVLAAFVLSGFKTEDTIAKTSFDAQKLETLIQNKINDIRQSEGLNRLSENSILKKAAEDQAEYIAELGKLSHRQPTPSKAKVRNRVELYGGDMRGVGENTVYIKALIPAIYLDEQGLKDTLTIDTYELAAQYMVNSWMNSAPHKTNILYKPYEFSGIKAVYNEKLNAIFAVQVFGFNSSN